MVLQVAPNARKSEVAGVQEDILKIRLHAAPVDGKANQALIRYTAEILDVPKTSVQITHGQSSRRKIVEVRASSVTVELARRAFVP
nr:DUF167 domain-containing protein [Noviherbaspirillum massiliense]